MRNPSPQLLLKANLRNFEKMKQIKCDFCTFQISLNPPIFSSTPTSACKDLASHISSQQTQDLDYNVDTTIISTSDKLKLHLRDLMDVAQDNWLSEDTINIYMGLVQQRSENKGNNKKDETILRVRVLSSHFVSPTTETERYRIVPRLMKDCDMNNLDLILIPVHVGHDHWAMVAIRIEQRLIELYNSKIEWYKEHHDGILTALKDFMDEYQPNSPVNQRKAPWNITSIENFPQQTNTCDCGIFALTTAEYLSRDAPLNFRQQDMKRKRWKISQEILQGRIIDDIL